MYSKILAAKKAVSYGILVHIISGRKDGLLQSLLDGHPSGTLFRPKQEKLSSRKGWIAYGSRAKGSLVLDEGAVKALVERGKSLLPSGIVDVEEVSRQGTRILSRCTRDAYRQRTYQLFFC